MSRAGIFVLIFASCGAPALAQQPTQRPEVPSGSTTVTSPPEAKAASTIARVAMRPPRDQAPVDALPCGGAGGAGGGLAGGDDVLVVRDGFVFVRLSGTGLALPMAGGGASGCIDPDSVQRGYRPDDLQRVLAPACPQRAGSRTAPN
jgi:hypothetical protein